MVTKREALALANQIVQYNNQFDQVTEAAEMFTEGHLEMLANWLQSYAAFKFNRQQWWDVAKTYKW